jgi:hypothetical protein
MARSQTARKKLPSELQARGGLQVEWVAVGALRPAPCSRASQCLGGNQDQYGNDEFLRTVFAATYSG